MKRNRGAHLALDLLDRSAARDAPGKLRRPRRLRVQVVRRLSGDRDARAVMRRRQSLFSPGSAGRDAAAGHARITLVRVQPADDRRLIRAARRGDRDAAGELFRRHWPAAWRAAYGVTGRRAMADDIAADAFERAFAALDRFDERRPFVPWLHRIV